MNALAMAEGPRTLDKTVETLGGKLRSNIYRTLDRTVRAEEAYRATGMVARWPRADHETMRAWIQWKARRMGAVPVSEPHGYGYDAYSSGPGAEQIILVRCLRPDTEAERALFNGVRLAPSTRELRYFDPEWNWSLSLA